MTLPELYEQQQRERDHFEALRQKHWDDLQKEQQQITGAFGSKENLPEDYRKRMDEQVKNYHQEWASETGQRHLELTAYHHDQRAAITGQPVNTQQKVQRGAKPDNERLSEKQAEMQKIIAQQQAIRKRQQEKKRHR